MAALKYLASKKDLKNLLAEYPDKIKYFANTDTFIGDSDAIEYITKKIQEYNKKSYDTSLFCARHENEGLEES